MVLVDGMNVIGSRPDGWWRDRTGAMRRLVGRVPEGALVVFDGHERDLGAPAGVEVRFAPVADDLLAELAGPGDTVVTSDRGLAARVRERGAEVISAGRFLRALDGS